MAGFYNTKIYLLKTSVYNIFFRGLTLVSKFIFVLFLGKYSLDEVNLGIYGLFVTSITMLIYFIGFDFYVFNTREIIASKDNILDKVINQLYFHIAVYLLVIPLATFSLIFFDIIPVNFLLVFLVLIIAEHLGQELYRLFTALEKSVMANIMLFFRSGFWVWIVLFDFFVLNNPIDLKKYLIFWSLFSGITFIFFLFGLSIHGKPSFKKPNYNWILKGLRTAGVFFLGSLSFQIIQFSDRFMIDYFYGKKMVGVYTTYAQFTNAIEVFTFSAITMVIYPKMLQSQSNIAEYKIILRKFLLNLILMSLLLIVLLIFVAPYIFDFLEKPAIIGEIDTFYILLIGIFFLITSNVFHYDLYVKEKDGIILKTAIIAVLLNITLNIILIPRYSIKGAAIATGMTFLTIFFLKLYYSKKQV